jgi:hypothetical protein
MFLSKIKIVRRDRRENVQHVQYVVLLEILKRCGRSPIDWRSASKHRNSAKIADLHKLLQRAQNTYDLLVPVAYGMYRYGYYTVLRTTVR